MNRTYVMGMLAVLTAGFTALAATAASATSVIGFGNAAYGNTCTNHGSATAPAATTHGAGTATSLAAALPISTPTNECGDIGLLNDNPIIGPDILLRNAQNL